MIKFKSLREARLNAADYTVGSEKFPKGGFRAQVKHTKKGHTMYLGSDLFKSPKDAEGQAKAYLDGYAASGDRGANRASDDYAKKNKSKLMKEDVELDEAFSSFAVPIPSQTLNGKKIGGGKTPIIVKARTAREAIQKAAKQLGVDFKFLKTGKVVKEGLEESIDEAGPTYIDGVKYQKEKKKKGFNKDDWEWNSSKQLYKKVDEAVELDEAFLRLPGEMINGELPMAIRDLESILKGLKAGNDFDAKGFNKQMARLTAVKKAAKKFNSEDEVPTRYNYTKK